MLGRGGKFGIGERRRAGYRRLISVGRTQWWRSRVTRRAEVVVEGVCSAVDVVEDLVDEFRIGDMGEHAQA
jgi:hypothetical protein